MVGKTKSLLRGLAFGSWPRNIKRNIVIGHRNRIISFILE